MKSDRRWNEIQQHMTLEHPSDAFTDEVMGSIRLAQQQQAQAIPPAARPNIKRISPRGRFSPEVVNVLLASAATVVFVATGLWSNVLSLQGGQFGLAVRDTVTTTIVTSLDLLTEAIQRL